MEITVDSDKCCGYGDCVLAAPDVYELGDDGVARVLQSGCADHGRLKSRLRPMRGLASLAMIYAPTSNPRALAVS
jgi:ferredoxin